MIKTRPILAKPRVVEFYTVKLTPEKETSPFYKEYNILLQTAEAVNNFNSLYKAGRSGARGGPSTHAQQDLYRAMLIFGCAGLDVFVKRLVKTKLPKLIAADQMAENKFRDYVKSGLKRDEKSLLSAVALAMIDPNPREALLEEYIGSMTGNSLQSVEQLSKVAGASGLNTDKLFTTDRRKLLKDAFDVRNDIIHEMDITVEEAASKTTRYRTRHVRPAQVMEGHTKNILRLAEDLLSAYKAKYLEYKIDVAKESKAP